MYFGGFGIYFLLKADFAKRVRGDVPVAYFLPGSAIAAFNILVATVFFVIAVILLQMLLTESAFCKIRAGWVRAGRFRFSRQNIK